MDGNLDDKKSNNDRLFDSIELIAIARITSMIFNASDSQIAPLTTAVIGMVLEGLNVPSDDVKHFAAMTLTIYRNEATDVIKKLSHEKKAKIAQVIAQTLVPDTADRFFLRRIGITGQQRFYHTCEICGLPWDIVNEVMITRHLKWAYKIRGYYFKDRESAVQAGKLIGAQENTVRKELTSLAENHPCIDLRALAPEESSSIVGMFVNIDCHIWNTFEEFEEEDRKRALQEDLQWYSQPAFVADDVSAWLDSMVERNRKEWGQ